MPNKNIFQDIKPITRKQRDLTVPRTIEPSTPVPALPHEIPFEPQEPRASSSHALWYIAALCVIVFLFSLSFLFERAVVTVTPKSLPVAFDSTDTYTAEKDSADPDTIVYTEMALTGDESIKLPGTESKDQAIAATGRAILYNNYSASTYKLVKGTRLATPDGQIYKIDTAVSVPGYTKSGSTTIPGSIEVGITAATPGEAANINKSDFTLPGLAGTAPATKIYGRTKTPITGGISGTVYTIPKDAASAAYGTLRDKLKASLLAKAKVQVPDGYIFYDGATLFSADDAVQVPYSHEEQVPLALHGTLNAYLIKADTLVTAIAEKSVSQYGGEPVTMPKLYTLTLTSAHLLAPDADTAFSFTLAGTADIVWTLDAEKIKAVLVGKKKSDFESLLGGVVGVERAEVVLKPFWKRSFPEDATRISVTVK